MVDAVIQKWGHVDIFVNNSGISGAVNLLENQIEKQVDRLVSVNYKGTLWGIQAAAKVLTSGGSIINISSITARTAMPVTRPTP